MPLRPVPGVARVVFRGQAVTQPVVNVMHVLNGGGPPGSAYTQSQIDQLAVSMASLFVGNLMPLTSTQYTALDCTATDLTSDVGVSSIAPMVGQGVGSGTSTPFSLAVVISWKIIRRYRGGHPRTYIGPPQQSSIASGTSFGTSFVTQVQNAATAFRGGVNGLVLGGSTQRLVCVHRYQGGVELPDPIVDVITGNSVDTRLDTQRRRLGRDR